MKSVFTKAHNSKNHVLIVLSCFYYVIMFFMISENYLFIFNWTHNLLHILCKHELLFWSDSLFASTNCNDINFPTLSKFYFRVLYTISHD